MIRKTRQPETWMAPEWHVDFGDANAELEHLRAFAIALLEVAPDAGVELEVPEPGLMNIAVELSDGATAEVYSISDNRSADKRRYGVFLAPDTPAEREIYQDSVDNAVRSVVDHK